MNCKKLIVLGSVNIDHILNVNEFPKPGETLQGSNYKISYGGKGANQAVAAGRLGANIQFIAAVGDDHLGNKIKQQLENDHIDTHSVSVIANENTGVALILVNAQGENQIAIHAGANSAVTPEYLSQFEDDIIKADAVLMQLETPLQTVEQVAKLAKQNNTQVVLNPAPAQKLSDDLLKNIDIITPNETEAEFLTGVKIVTEQDAQKASLFLHNKGIKIVIITLGSKGAWVSNCGKGEIISGFRVKAVDTIGAGDTFNGMLVTALLEGKTLNQAVRYAHAAGALSVTKSGAQISVPTRKEVEDFIILQDL
ncbi:MULTISPECIES: ribokinase [unclassified Gilliamella]|uniref:ribokinase n=1 Tax=unclassified Gilliamella TaxID=2685620 RepID=UPI001327E8F4|nr:MULTISPECIES: ribokinase [unclassified Gilliamella]MWN31315.1 ribokinase [Gilliamella sp. Pra-s60]MWP29077.1 ribokinase [Gilliamella sp. Pra-s54]